MSLVIEAEPVPLALDADGVVHVGGTRVTLDTVITAFHQRATAEEVAQQYPPLQLADVYGVFAYYLHRRAEVDAYLRQHETDANLVRGENEKRFDPSGIRERLLARQICRSGL